MEVPKQNVSRPGIKGMFTMQATVRMQCYNYVEITLPYKGGKTSVVVYSMCTKFLPCTWPYMPEKQRKMFGIQLNSRMLKTVLYG